MGEDKPRKKRRTFWAWLMGEELPAEAPAPEPREAPPADQEGPIPVEGAGESPEPPPGRAPYESPCPACGGTHFRWGWMETGLYGIGKGLRGPADQPGRLAVEDKWVKRKTRFGEYIGLRARLCQDCGHVDIFAHSTE